MTHPKNTQLLAVAPPDTKSIGIAKQYITDNNLTSDDVKLVKLEGVIVVVQR